MTGAGQRHVQFADILAKPLLINPRQNIVPGLEKELVGKVKGDKLADIRAQAGQYVLRLNTTAGAVRVDLDNVYRAVATMYCELRNDALAVDAMAAQLNGSRVAIYLTDENCKVGEMVLGAVCLGVLQKVLIASA